MPFERCLPLFLYRPPFRCLSLRKSTGNCENFHGQLEKNSWATGEKTIGNVFRNDGQRFSKPSAMKFASQLNFEHSDCELYTYLYMCMCTSSQVTI